MDYYSLHCKKGCIDMTGKIKRNPEATNKEPGYK
jgi:hypothetical protein